MTTHFNYPPAALQEQLRKVAEAMVTPKKGILATDDTLEGMGDRLKSVGLQNTEDGRRLYRQMMFTTDPKVLYRNNFLEPHHQLGIANLSIFWLK